MPVWLGIDNCDSDMGWLQLNLLLGFMMAQRDWAGGYTDIRYAGFCQDRDNSNSSDSDSIKSDSYIESDSVCSSFHFQFCLKLPVQYPVGTQGLLIKQYSTQYTVH